MIGMDNPMIRMMGTAIRDLKRLENRVDSSRAEWMSKAKRITVLR